MPHEPYYPALFYVPLWLVLVPRVLASRPFEKRVYDVGMFTKRADMDRAFSRNFSNKVNILT